MGDIMTDSIHMSRKKLPALIISNNIIGKDIWDMTIEAPEAASAARPGQFVMVYPKSAAMLLPRPISICEVDRAAGHLRLVYRIAGKGTSEFAGLHADDTVDVLGPIGNGFPISEGAGKRVAVMGGGIGIPPLVELSKALKAAGDCTSIEIYPGYRDGELFLSKELEVYGSVHVATEDGSVGVKGNVLDALAAATSSDASSAPEVIYACGPMPMLRAIKAYAQKAGIPAYISLEERMACGVGACLGCVCKTTHKDDHSNVNNARVCTEGPVFEAKDVEI